MVKGWVIAEAGDPGMAVRWGTVMVAAPTPAAMVVLSRRCMGTLAVYPVVTRRSTGAYWVVGVVRYQPHMSWPVPALRWGLAPRIFWMTGAVRPSQGLVGARMPSRRVGLGFDWVLVGLLATMPVTALAAVPPS